jgi:hypothetical protein
VRPSTGRSRTKSALSSDIGPDRLGLYLIAVAMFLAGRAQALASSSRWAVWVLPLVLCFDNVTYGLVGGHPGAILWQAGEQVASSALLAGAGLAVSLAITRALSATHRRAAVANGLAGGAARRPERPGLENPFTG